MRGPWRAWVTCVVLACLQRKVQLLSPDKQTFEVEWDVAMRSTVVKQMLEGAFRPARTHVFLATTAVVACA